VPKHDLIPLYKACEKYGKTDDGFYSSAFLIKKETGIYPEWYVKNLANDVFIDVYHYEKWAILERKAWLHATNDIYFLLSYDFGCTDAQIARFMTRHSKKFTNESSWSSFLTKALFSLPRESILKKHWSMTIEFAYTGSYMVKLLLDNEKNIL